MTQFVRILKLALGAGAIMLPAAAMAENPATNSSASAKAASSSQPILAHGAKDLLNASLAGKDRGLESHATVYSGYYHAGSGYADRFVSGAFIDLYPGATGFHADLVYVNREENGAFAAVGLSHQIGRLGRLKLMAGTSTHRNNVLPNLSLQATLEVKPAEGLILRPAVTYRRFRNGGSQIAPALQIAHYFGGSSGGYFVAQADGGVNFTNSGKTGWTLAAGLTRVQGNGLRVGFAARTGYMAYDSIVGTEVRSKLYGGGPNIGYRFISGHEIFLRTDVTRNKFYTVSGAIVGFKTPL